MYLDDEKKHEIGSSNLQTIGFFRHGHSQRGITRRRKTWILAPESSQALVCIGDESPGDPTMLHSG